VISTPCQLQTSAGARYESPDGSVSNVTINSAITANPLFLYEEGVKFTFVSGTAEVTTDNLGFGSATGTLTFKVEPFGGTLTKFATATNATGVSNSVTVKAYEADGDEYTTGATAVVTVNPDDNVEDGGSATVTVQMVVTDDGSTNPGLVRFKIDAINWTVGSTTVNQYDSTTAGNMFDNWVTNYVDLR